MEDSLHDYPDIGLRITSMEVAADRVDIRVSAPKGMARSLANGGGDMEGTWSNSCGAMTAIVRKASEVCAANGREDIPIYALMLSDANPDRVLYALRGGSIVYNVRSAPIVGEPIEAEMYILNTSTKVIHNTWCPSVPSIGPKHILYSFVSLALLQGDGYTKCRQSGDWDKVPTDPPPADTVGTLLDELGGGVSE